MNEIAVALKKNEKCVLRAYSQAKSSLPPATRWTNKSICCTAVVARSWMRSLSPPRYRCVFTTMTSWGSQQPMSTISSRKNVLWLTPMPASLGGHWLPRDSGRSTIKAGVMLASRTGDKGTFCHDPRSAGWSLSKQRYGRGSWRRLVVMKNVTRIHNSSLLRAFRRWYLLELPGKLWENGNLIKTSIVPPSSLMEVGPARNEYGCAWKNSSYCLQASLTHLSSSYVVSKSSKTSTCSCAGKHWLADIANKRLLPESDK